MHQQASAIIEPVVIIVYLFIIIIVYILTDVYLYHQALSMEYLYHIIMIYDG